MEGMKIQKAVMHSLDVSEVFYGGKVEANRKNKNSAQKQATHQ